VAEFWPEVVAALGGVILGFIGTLIGAGGGFLLVPILVFLEPGWSTEIVTAFSLAVVAANASTGALSYWQQRRVDVRSFVIFALAATPGSIAGVYVSALVPRRLFDPIFGTVLLLIAVWLLVRPSGSNSKARAKGNTSRQLVDAAGNRHVWSFDAATGIAGSASVGFVSSFLGIGGGIIHVPLLVTLLNFPEHIATATSHAVLAVTSIVGTLVHVFRGDYRTDGSLVIACSVGAIAGAPLGARASVHVSGPVILRILAIGLAFVGLRLMFAAFVHS
jgi:uncharacterized membrane protein YfcA